MSRLVLFVFLSFAATAEARLFRFSSSSPLAIIKDVGAIKEGDTIAMDGQPFEVEAVLGNGSFGYAFKVKGPNRTEVLKVLKDPALLGKPDNPQSFVQQAANLRAYRGKVAVPEVYEAPPHGLYLRMEFIDGENFRTRYGRLPKTELLAELRKVDALWADLEKTGLNPQLGNIPANMVYSQSRQKYFLVDPDHVKREDFLPTFYRYGLGPTAALIRFERWIAEGKYPESAKRLKGKGPAFSAAGTINREWALEYVAQSTEPKLSWEVFGEISWVKVPAKDETRFRERLHEIAREKIAALVEGSRIQETEVKLFAALFSSPLFDDMSVIEAVFKRLSQFQFKELKGGLRQALQRKVDALPWVKEWTENGVVEHTPGDHPYPTWLKEASETYLGLSYLNVEHLWLKIARDGREKGRGGLLKALMENDLALYRSLEFSEQSALYLPFVSEFTPAEDLALATQLFAGSATNPEKYWLRLFSKNYEDNLFKIALSPEYSREERARAIQYGDFSFQKLIGLLRRINEAPLRQLALAQLLEKAPSVDETAVDELKKALKDSDEPTRVAAQAVRDKWIQEKPDLKKHFRTWRAWLTENLCFAVLGSAAPKP